VNARGFVLLPVLAFILVIAVIAYGATRSGPAAVAGVSSAADRISARYAAEAGMSHANWAAEQSNCGNYTNITNAAFGSAKYDATYSARSGSPVMLTATSTLPGGAACTLTRTIHVYQLPVSMENQPGAQNADTFIRQSSGAGQGTNHKIEAWKKAGDEARTLLQVDLSSLPAGAHVVSAVLQIEAETVHLSGPSAQLAAHRITRAWSETNATWSNYDVVLVLGQPWTTAGGDFDPVAAASVSLPDETKGWKSFDLTVLVQQWLAGTYPNYGVLLKANSSVDDFKLFSSDDVAANRPKVVIQYVCECGTTCAPVTPAGTTLLLSTLQDSTLGGLTFKDGDVVRYDPAAATATAVLLESSLFAMDEDIDALQAYEGDDRVVLSTETDASLSGLAFADEDLVEYSPSSGVAVLLFDGSAHFAADEDIDGAYVYDDGRIALSTRTDATLAGLAFNDDDIVEYDPTVNTATLVFDGALHFSANENIDALQMLEDGRFLLSTDSDATLGGLTFTDADVVLYDPLNDTAAKVFDGAGVTGAADADVDAVYDYRPHPLDNELRLEPVADTYINNALPTQNFGGAPNLMVGSNLRSLLRFDLASLPIGATVTSAKLYLSLGTSGSALVFGAYKVTATWAEGTATWSNIGGGSFDALPLGSASFSPAPARWVSWNLSPALIQEWRDGVTPNYGVLIKPTLVALSTVSARSRNQSSGAVHPRLVIKFTLP
jgi:hypothetical protein